MQPLEAGDPRAIGEYRLLRRIGSGGMGRVYLGRSPGGRTVAVKAVHPHFAADEQFRTRFRREVDSARRVGGTWTAPVLDADPDAPVPWVATGYVTGPSLQQAVGHHGPLPEATVRALGASLAEALGAVHALGLVHRDVKPSNVLLALDGPRLIDFGIARATDGTTGLTTTGASIGSPGYMSPEQALGRGGVEAPSDVFSLGSVLAYATTGSAPFPGDSSAALLYHVVHEDPDLSGLPPGELRELIEHCLAKRPADRPEPGAVVRALAGAGGAEALTRSGWLPGPVVEEISRNAVALLDMAAAEEAAEQAGGTRFPAADGPACDGPAVSGLVPFTDLPHGPAEPLVPPAPAPPDPDTPPDQDARHEKDAPPDPDAHEQDATHDRRQHQAERGGRFSVSARTTSRAGRRSGPQVSCTLVLSVAGALAAGSLAAGLALDLLPGAGPHDVPPSVARPEPSGSTQDDGQGGDEGPGSVPKAFLGTWQGQLSTADGLPAGVLTVTLTPGEADDLIGTGTLKQAIVGDVCPAEWSLEGATDRRLTVVATSPGGGEGCPQGESRGAFRLLPGGGMRYESSDAAAGGHTGTLHKTG